MIAQVNALIYNTLVAGKDLYMPQVGSLVVRRKSATIESSKSLVPPCRKVTFTGEQRGESLVDVIATTAAVDNTRAEDIYRQWLQGVSSDGVVTIDGVGRVANRQFAIDEQLYRALNPHSLEPIQLKRRTSPLLYVVLSLLLVVVVAVSCLLLVDSAPSAEITAQTTEVEAQSVADEPLAEPAAVVDSLAIVTTPAETVVTNDVETLQAGYSYIVWGVYSKEENARSYKAVVESRYSDLQCTIYHYKNNTMYMVAVASRPSRGECIAVMRSLKERGAFFDQLWIFTNK